MIKRLVKLMGPTMWFKSKNDSLCLSDCLNIDLKSIRLGQGYV